jgi:hypothetical protein
VRRLVDAAVLRAEVPVAADLGLALEADRIDAVLEQGLEGAEPVTAYATVRSTPSSSTEASHLATRFT